MPRAVIHKCVPVTNFRDPVDLLRLRNIQSFKRQWLVKSALGQWEPTIRII